MNNIKQLITVRRLSLWLILAVVGLMYLSTVVPQEIESAPEKIEKWRLDHAGLLWLIDAVHLQSVYAQPWFVATILISIIALGISSFDQWGAARKKLASTGIGPGEEVAAFVSEQKLRSVARSNRYRVVRTGSRAQLKFVRNPWGYFGVLMLHVGMILVIAVSLYVSMTSRQGVLMLVEGEQRDQLTPWDAYQQGMLASPLKLPGSIRLNKVKVDFAGENHAAQVSSEISFTDRTGKVDSLTPAINRMLNYRGLRIYHAAHYGAAFTVTITDTSGVPHTERIMIQHPAGLAKAAYSSDFTVAWSPYLFDAKYYLDTERKNMPSSNPDLVVRMREGNWEVARSALTKGIPGTLGKYRIVIDDVEKWAKLIVVDVSGMSAVFAGFAVIMTGGLIHYMTPPRELIGIQQPDGSYRVIWRAIAFKEFYQDERDDIARELPVEMTS